MNQSIEQHTPSSAFVNTLESEVVAAFRRQSSYNVPPSARRRRRRIRTALTLAIGLAVGAGTVVASAQVQEAKVRDSLALSSELERTLAAMRQRIAEESYQAIKKSVDAGARSKDDLLAAELQLKNAEMLVRRSSLQLEEILATGAAPRLELWSPLNGKRDFVTERLKNEAMVTNEKIVAYERALVESRLKVSVGAAAPDDTLNARWELSNAERDLAFVARQLSWREGFLENKMNEEQIAKEMQLYGMMNQVKLTVERLLQAQARAKRAKEREAASLGSIVDTKRAELDVLEGSIEVEKVQKLLKMLQAAQALNKKD